ncbi:unnamed protein product [Boreogadus saida]
MWIPKICERVVQGSHSDPPRGRNPEGKGKGEGAFCGVVQFVAVVTGQLVLLCVTYRLGSAEDQGGKERLRAGRTSGPRSCDICHSADACFVPTHWDSWWSLMSRGRGAQEPLMFVSRAVNGRQSPEHRAIPNAGSPPQPPSSGAPAGAMAPGGRPRFSCNSRRLESN